jgi:hypothetical protein
MSGEIAKAQGWSDIFRSVMFQELVCRCDRKRLFPKPDKQTRK